MIGWTLAVGLFSLVVQVLCISAEDGRPLSNGLQSREEGQSKENTWKVLDSDVERNQPAKGRDGSGSAPVEEEELGPLDNDSVLKTGRNLWTKSLVKNHIQRTNFPKINLKQRIKVKNDNRIQRMMTPKKKRNVQAKSAKKNRNQRTKPQLGNRLISPGEGRAEILAGKCSEGVMSTTHVTLDDRVRFTSPDFPFPYPKDTNCGWTLETDASNELEIYCDLVDIRAKDFLIIEDGSGGEIARYTKRTTAILAFGTGERSIEVKFSSDSKTNGMGFACYASAIEVASANPTAATQTPAPRSNSECKCGKKLDSRIVGGKQASKNEYPWMVGMVGQTWTGEWYIFCGGTIISSEWIVTAAHCLSVDYVVIGEYDLTKSDSSTEMRPVLQTIRHPNYSTTTNNYDIALLRIDPIDFATLSVRPICLPDDTSEDYTGQTATITGWGTVSYQGAVASVLREVDVPVISNSLCASKYAGYAVTNKMMCAASPSGGLDSCQGDSGGPLIVADGPNFELVGVVSWGVGCALKEYPGVYTRVTAVTNWITSKTGSDGYCPRE